MDDFFGASSIGSPRGASPGRLFTALFLAVAAMCVMTVFASSCTSAKRTVTRIKSNTQEAKVDQGVIVIRYIGGLEGYSSVQTMTTDGLVWHSDRDRSSTSLGRLVGRVPADNVKALIRRAQKLGFFGWRPLFLPGQKDVTSSLKDGLEIWAEPNARGTGWLHHNSVMLNGPAMAPVGYPELLTSCTNLAIESRKQLFPPDTAAAIIAAKALFMRVRRHYSDAAWAQGPAISQQVVPGWAVDIVHVPRQAVDDLPKNQAASYNSGKVKHFVELDMTGNFVRAQ
jgi:hypothetical protein